jgi:hypothetical protein
MDKSKGLFPEEQILGSLPDVHRQPLAATGFVGQQMQIHYQCEDILWSIQKHRRNLKASSILVKRLVDSIAPVLHIGCLQLQQARLAEMEIRQHIAKLSGKYVELLESLITPALEERNNIVELPKSAKAA